MAGWVGKKLYMTTFVGEDGSVCPTTVLQIYPSHILRIKTRERDGYNAVVIGYEQVAKERLKKPQLGEFEKRNLSVWYRKLKEFRVERVEGYEPGQEWKCELKPGDRVDITGWSKGRGFQGVVKRYRFAGAPDSHGVSVVHRRPMSIGSRWPQRVVKGKRMPGRMGNERKTIKNLLVLKVEDDRIYVKGCVPGARNSLVLLNLARGWKPG